MSEDMDKNIQKAIEIISNPETLNGLLSVLGNAGNNSNLTKPQLMKMKISFRQGYVKDIGKTPF